MAITRVIEAIAEDQQRILLTLATGTGKTFIAFQIAWKPFHSRWNLSREATRRPRVLFLADRNILANQAFNAFSAFPEDALVRIDPGDIRKKGRVPKNGSLFFTILQTFMSGRAIDGEPSAYFGEYVSVGVEELDQAKLAPLLKLRYHDSINDAVADLGEDIGATFTGFQKFLYSGVA